MSAGVVLVEGVSDRIAIETLARRLGRDLAADDVTVVPVGGAHAIGRFLGGVDVASRVAVLCDVGEEPAVARAIARSPVTRLGLFVCDRDLEDELIRALGVGEVEALLEANGDLSPFRTLQKQEAWRGRPTDEQLRRFMGSGGRRKARYARILVDALDPERVPPPLAGALGHV
jgi:predicted ATP-dependent endonuclease of OLD family